MTKKTKPIHAIHIGVSGFPFGSAAINKCLYVYKSIEEKGVRILVINNRAVHPKKIPIKIKKKGVYQNIPYVYTSISPYKPSSFLKRRLSNIIGKMNELLLIMALKLKGKLDVAFFYPDGSFTKLLYYRFLSKIFRFSIISHYVEYRTAFASRNNKPIRRLLDYCFDNYFTCFVDGVLPISDFLQKKIETVKCKRPFVKIPPITDFTQFNKTEQLKSNYGFFLYCGSAGYTETIRFIINSFDLLDNVAFYLHLVINGNNQQLEKVNRIIKQSYKAHLIKIFSKLPIEDLFLQYIEARALLIPLTDSIQDQARFPQKISEYLASGNPIVTTNFGEVKFYFTDNKNALIANNYTEIEFSGKMRTVIEKPDMAKIIGTAGKNLGLANFHYSNYGQSIIDLINRKVK